MMFFIVCSGSQDNHFKRNIFLGWQTFEHTDTHHLTDFSQTLCEIKGTLSHCKSMTYKIQHLSVIMVTALFVCAELLFRN